MAIEVASEIKVYEVDGRSPESDVRVRVKSHWNRREFVVLVVNGEALTVAARDLRAAIDNATNTGAL